MTTIITPTSRANPAPQERHRPRPSRPLLTRLRTDHLPGWLFLLPIVVVFTVLLIIPLSQSVYYSFTDFDGYSLDLNFVGWANYARVFSDSNLLAGLGFTIFFAIASTALITIFAIPLAVILNQRFFGRNFVRSVFFFPAVPSIALLGLVWGFILNPLGSGALNTFLQTVFGLGPFPWLSNSTLAQISVVLVAVWSATGWHAILYLAYLQSIPTDYYEVATIDGASARQRFFHITLPLLAPAVTISTLLLMTGGLKVYDLPYTLTSGGPGVATYTITQSILVGGIAQGRYGVASALSVVFLIAVAIVVLLQLWVSRRLEGRIL